MWNIQIWRAVLQDLWRFMWGTETLPMLQLPAESQPKKPLLTPHPAHVTRSVVPAVSVPVVMQSTPDERYIIATQAPVSISPYQGFDTTFATVRFGEAVTVRAYQGEYAQVMTAAGPGWVHKDVLEPERQRVWANLMADAVYDADSVATQLVRRHLNDSFNAAVLHLPLQSVEYISYRLLQVKRTINWGTARPRVPGLWQQQLKGRPGIHIGVQPLADSVMEYRNHDGEGVLLYVEAVAPDNTLTCSTVGLEESGQYTSHMYSQAKWREWRPVFIEID